MDTVALPKLFCFLVWMCVAVTKRLILLIDKVIDIEFDAEYCHDFLLCADNIRRVSSVSSMSSTSGSSMTVLPTAQDGTRNDFDTASIESCFLSPTALQNIREQMALSLERTRQLEEQVRLLPQLKVSVLRGLFLGRWGFLF